jgi:hypothetical protein
MRGCDPDDRDDRFRLDADTYLLHALGRRAIEQRWIRCALERIQAVHEGNESAVDAYLNAETSNIANVSERRDSDAARLTRNGQHEEPARLRAFVHAKARARGEVDLEPSMPMRAAVDP